MKIKVARVARPVGLKKKDMRFGKPRLPGLPGVCLLVSKFLPGVAMLTVDTCCQL